METLTRLHLKFNGKLVRQRLFYSTGNQANKRSGKTEFIEFEPNQIICFVREEFVGKKFRPQKLYVAKTLLPGDLGSDIDGIQPGVEILLKVNGESRMKRTIEFIMNITASGVDLRQLSDSVFSAIHTRNEAGMSLEFLAERVVEDSKFR